MTPRRRVRNELGIDLLLKVIINEINRKCLFRLACGPRPKSRRQNKKSGPNERAALYLIYADRYDLSSGSSALITNIAKPGLFGLFPSGGGFCCGFMTGGGFFGGGFFWSSFCAETANVSPATIAHANIISLNVLIANFTSSFHVIRLGERGRMRPLSLQAIMMPHIRDEAISINCISLLISEHPIRRTISRFTLFLYENVNVSMNVILPHGSDVTYVEVFGGIIVV